MKQIQEQTQKAIQSQRLSQQQVLFVKLLGMPIAELEENVRRELDDNPAIEERGERSEEREMLEIEERGERSEESGERKDEEWQDELDAVLKNMGGDDEMEDFEGTRYEVRGTRDEVQSAREEETVWGATTSFYDKLMEQVGEEVLTDQERDILEYLIGSLDEDGLLRKPLEAIADELAVYHNIDVSTDEIERLLKVLQGFDPPGIGARSLQECLLIQLEGAGARGRGGARNAVNVIRDYYNLFIQKRWDEIARQLGIDEEEMDEVRKEILRLNPKPGASLGEVEGRNIHQITPDFIVETADNGTVSFSINNGRVPELSVSESFSSMLDEYKNNGENMNRQAKEALLYARQKVESANNYISALKQRQQTLYLTMKTIIDLQRKFFQEGDEADLRPMTLKDVAERTGLDISTISRVCNEKYAQTRWGTYKLRFFFSEGIAVEGGEEMSTRRIKIVLKEIIDAEDKSSPMSDEEIAKTMKEKGFPIARRTVSKYREQMGIPSAKMRD